VNQARIVAVFVMLVAASIAAWMIYGRSPRERLLSGYIEGQSLYLAAPVAGTIQSIAAVEGARVNAGQPLFTIDPATLSAQGEQARASVAAARTQIAVAEATARQADAEAMVAGAEAEHARRDLARLLSVKADDAAAVANKDIDAARAALREADSRVAAARRSADSRRAQIAAARAHAEETRGGAREVQIRVDQLASAAPAAARVEDVFFQPGEWVSANQPVVNLLPDNKVKVRFFVPEKEVARYRPGREVRFSCDACASGMTARIAYVSSRPEFTPPIIYSRDSRDRLVFMVEAYPRNPARLQPGLPVDVEPLQ
jgi:HlyD family secretion protein